MVAAVAPEGDDREEVGFGLEEPTSHPDARAARTVRPPSPSPPAPPPFQAVYGPVPRCAPEATPLRSGPRLPAVLSFAVPYVSRPPRPTPPMPPRARLGAACSSSRPPSLPAVLDRSLPSNGLTGPRTRCAASLHNTRTTARPPCASVPGRCAQPRILLATTTDPMRRSSPWAPAALLASSSPALADRKRRACVARSPAAFGRAAQRGPAAGGGGFEPTSGW